MGMLVRTKKSVRLCLGRLETIQLIIFITFSCANPTVQQTNSQPVNVGLIAALPWDVSNTLRAPIGGPVSLALSAAMALILLFGFLLAPINYILGYPSRIYHPARKPGLLTELIYKDEKKEPLLKELTELVTNIAYRTGEEMFGDDESESRKFSFHPNPPRKRTFTESGTARQNAAFPDFISSAFFLIPEKDLECQKLILCHAHGFLTIFPTRLTKIIRFFSKRLMSMPQEYQSAVILGLNKQDECQRIFKCTKNISILLKNVLYSLLSNETKEIWKLQKLF